MLHQICVIYFTGLSDIHDASSGQRSSGLNSRESTPLSAQAEINLKLAQLKSDLHVLRKQQQLNMEAMKDEFAATCSQIKVCLIYINSSGILFFSFHFEDSCKAY